MLPEICCGAHPSGGQEKLIWITKLAEGCLLRKPSNVRRWKLLLVRQFKICKLNYSSPRHHRHQLAWSFFSSGE